MSQMPPSAPPARVVTSPDGVAQLRVQPGTYVVESERPIVVNGRAYEWTATIDVAAGHDTTLELTPANASTSALTPELAREAAADSRARVPVAAAILSAWQASAFELWTPDRHGAGFLVDGRGLVATSARSVGDATAMEVQVSPSLKVAGAVIAADAASDVAVVRVHPSAIDGIVPVVVACGAAAVPTAEGDRYVMSVPLFGPKDVDTFPDVPAGAAGGPVFTAGGDLVGLASPVEPDAIHGRTDIRVIGLESLCRALASASATLASTPPPAATRLPVERARGAQARAIATPVRGTFTLDAYQISSSDFDVTFVTPEVLRALRGKDGWTGGREAGLSGRRVATDFGGWSRYVADAPPLLFVRATPRLAEAFWTKVARAAASTQGATFPPIERLRPDFSRMRLVCGDREVTPIHPFRIRTRVTEADAIDEGFYVFDPLAIGPGCGTVSIVLSSVKDPGRSETRTIPSAIVQRVTEDFAGVRAPLQR
ncbi:MAG: hypothetical protein IT184_17830 [Acidobacteria bacterium]|nr:hypothetical protein [Acidobacteriota bacterium]